MKDSSQPLVPRTLGSSVLVPRLGADEADVRWVEIMTETNVQHSNTLHS